MELKHNIKIKNISKYFIEKSTKIRIDVFRDFSLELPIDKEDRIISLVGKSGSGKTTLLRMIAGLDIPNTGEIFVNNIKVATPTLQTTLIPQSFTCFPWLNVYDNIAFGLNIKKEKDVKEIVFNVAKQMGLEDRLNAYPNELSGGMQQRVAIGRALAVDTPIVIMDEPFGSLDIVTRKEMQKLVVALAERNQKLFLLVTHDIIEATAISDHIVIFPEKPIQEIKKVYKVKTQNISQIELYNRIILDI